MSADPAILARLRAICLALPRAEEKVSHGQPLFFIARGKGFAWYLDDHHGIGITAVAVKTTGADEQDALIDADPALYYRPAYLAPSGWIGIRLDLGETDWDHVAAKVRGSWCLAAPPRLREMLA